MLDAPDVFWAGRMATNPVHRIGDPDDWRVHENRSATHSFHLGRLHVVDEDRVVLRVPLSGKWIDIAFTVTDVVRDGGLPLVTTDDATSAMRAMLAIAAGADRPESLPPVIDGTATVTAQWDPEQVADHTGVTATFGAPLAPTRTVVPDALVGKCWPAVFAARRLGGHRHRHPGGRGLAEPGAPRPRRATTGAAAENRHRLVSLRQRPAS